MTIVYVVNIVFFILTSWKIRELKNDVDEMMSKKGNAREMKKTKDGLAIHYLFRVHCTCTSHMDIILKCCTLFC